MSDTSVSREKSTNVRYGVSGPVRLGFRVAARVAPTLTGRAAAHLFCLTQGRRQPSERERLWLADAEPLALTSDGHPLAAWTWGEGPIVLLHHGWNGRAAQMGAFAAPLVAAGFRVVAYDAPGHGGSPGRSANGVLLARTIGQVCRQLGGVHAVVGHSLGCLATAYALRTPQPIERAVFVSPPAEMEIFMLAFADLVGMPDRVYAVMHHHFEQWLDMDWQDWSAEHLAAADRRARGSQTPLLVVHDGHDPQVPFQHGRRYAKAWDGAQFKLTRGLGHQRILRDEGVVRAAVAFIAEKGAVDAAG